MNNFEYTGETFNFNGRILRQIRATKDIGDDVKAGDIGGWIESADSLCGTGWVFPKGRLMKHATIYGGRIHRGVVYGGTIYNGEVRSGYMMNGTLFNGVIDGGILLSGKMYGGTLRKGKIHKG